MKYRPGDPRFQAHLDDVVGPAGGVGTVATARRDHPLITAEELPNDDLKTRLFQVIEEQDAAEERIANRTRESAAGLVVEVIEEASAHDSSDAAYTGCNSEAGKGNEAAIASARRQAGIENMHLNAVRLRGVHEIFPTQLANLLIAAGVNTMGELETWSKTRLTTIPGIKDGRAQVIDEEMTEIGLPLAKS